MSKEVKFMKVLIVLFLFSSLAYGHGNEDHDESELTHTNQKTQLDQTKIVLIKNKYEKDIEPIFKVSCFDCHTNQTKFPWYYKIPGIKQWMNHHIEEAKEHLDMTQGYPFKGHGDLLKDLEEIKEVIEEDEMPMWSYTLMHSEAKLTKKQKEAIYTWVKMGMRILSEK